MTGAEFLLLLNPDTEFVEERTTERLLDSVARRPAVVAAGPRLVGPDGRAQRWDHGRLHGIRAQISNRGGASYWRETSERQDVAWVSGAAMLVRHAAFAAVDGFDERFFLYKEDEDLCLRLRRAGGVIAYEPSVRVRHHGSVVAGRGAELARSERYFIEKHFANHPMQPVFAAVHRLLPYLHL
jgi:N-acetylglucosaminyl-diphospho-decaprenol L-rhamnosyltransferase